GNNRAGDEVPILAEREGNDGLDVGRVTHGVGRADAEVPIVLNGHADQTGDRVLEFLGQFGGGLVVGGGVLREERSSESERADERGGEEVLSACGLHGCGFQKSNSRLRPSVSAGQGSKPRERRVLERGEWPVNEWSVFSNPCSARERSSRPLAKGGPVWQPRSMKLTAVFEPA